jgi:hypothetical protein
MENAHICPLSRFISFEGGEAEVLKKCNLRNPCAAVVTACCGPGPGGVVQKCRYRFRGGNFPVNGKPQVDPQVDPQHNEKVQMKKYQ